MLVEVVVVVVVVGLCVVVSEAVVVVTGGLGSKSENGTGFRSQIMYIAPIAFLLFILREVDLCHSQTVFLFPSVDAERVDEFLSLDMLRGKEADCASFCFCDIPPAPA